MYKKKILAIIILFFFKNIFLKLLHYKIITNVLQSFFSWKLLKLKQNNLGLFLKWFAVTVFLLQRGDVHNILGCGIDLIDYLIFSIMTLYLILFFKRFYNFSPFFPLIQVVQHCDPLVLHMSLNIKMSWEELQTLLNCFLQKALSEKHIFSIKLWKYIVIVRALYLLCLFNFSKFIRNDFWVLLSWTFFIFCMLHGWSVYNRFGQDLLTVHYFFFSLVMLLNTYVYKRIYTKKSESLFFFLQLIIIWLVVLKRLDTTIELVWIWNYNVPTLLEFTEMCHFVAYDFKWFFYINNRIIKECPNYSNDLYTYCESAFNDVYSW